MKRPLTSGFYPQCKLPLAVLSAACCIVAFSPPSSGQTHHVNATERVTRAVAVYEWTGDLSKPNAARLVPVSLFIEGHMEDAGVYLSRPVPFALQTGDLYEVEKAGASQGVFSLDHARHVVPTADPSAEGVGVWYAYGRFTPPKSAAPPPALQRSTQPSAIVSSADSSRPHFGGKSASDTTSSAPSKPAASTSSASTPPASASPAAPPPSSSGPQLSKPGDSGSSDSKDTKSSKDDDLDRPTLRKRDPAEDAQRRKAASQSGVTSLDSSLNDDPDRPTMRRGPAPGSAETAELTGIPADLHQVAAVSDPTTRDTHIFAREWESSGERTDTLSKLEALARPQVAAYITANNLTPGPPDTPPSPATPTTGTATVPGQTSPVTTDENAPKLQRGVPKAYQPPSAAPKPVAPKPTPKTAAAKRTASKATPPPPLALAEEQLTPYTLSYGGLPTFVYTAQASVKTGGPVYVTVVAQRLVSGDMQVALSSVTDASHLNRTPWLRLVDAVDPDASHRASLLFELRAQTTRQFALFRLTSAKADQIFTTSPM